MRLDLKLPDALVNHPDGEVRLAGSRIGLYHLIHHLDGGESAEELSARFPTLDPSRIREVIAFALAHRSEVDAYMASYRAELDRQRAAGGHAPGLEELRRNLEARSRRNPVTSDRI